MRPQAPSDATYYRDPTGWRWFGVAVILISALGAGFLSLGALALGEVVFGLIVASAMAACFVIAWRYRKMGTLRADSRGITEYRPIRNRFWRWEEVERFSVEVRILPFKLVQSRVLVMHAADGRARALDTIVASPKSGTTSWVDLAATDLNHRLAVGKHPPTNLN